MAKAKTGFMAALATCCNCLMFWRKKGINQSPIYAKRQLLYSRRSVVGQRARGVTGGVVFGL